MGNPEELGKYQPLTYFQMMEVSLRERWWKRAW